MGLYSGVPGRLQGHGVSEDPKVEERTGDIQEQEQEEPRSNDVLKKEDSQRGIRRTRLTKTTTKNRGLRCRNREEIRSGRGSWVRFRSRDLWVTVCFLKLQVETKKGGLLERTIQSIFWV